MAQNILNTDYMMYGIFSTGDANETILKQVYQTYGVKRVIVLDNNVFARVKDRVQKNQLNMQVLNYHMDPGNTAQALSMMQNVKSLIPGSAQNPVLITCLHGQDRTGFLIASWFVKTGRALPCAAIKMLETTHGYGNGLNELQKTNYDKVLGCSEGKLKLENDLSDLLNTNVEINESDDVVDQMRDDFGQIQGGLTDGARDGGYWADNIGFGNNLMDSDAEKYPGSIGARARRNFLNRIINSSCVDKIHGGRADCINKKFNEKQLLKGIKVEMEHTDDPQIALEIAKDHLTENDKYYDALEDMESKFDVNDAFLGGGPSGSPTGEAPPATTEAPAIPGYIADAERRKKRRDKLLKILEDIEDEEELPINMKLIDVGMTPAQMGPGIANTFNAPSGAPGAPNAAGPSEPSGLVQL